MTQYVLDIGNCAPDHAAIRQLIEENFDAKVDQADNAVDALASLRQRRFALVLINRKLDCDYSDGIEVIRQIRGALDVGDTPCMLITNYAEHQESAVSAGAVEGFGKLSFEKPETREKLARYLTEYRRHPADGKHLN